MTAEANKELIAFREKIRTAIADYMKSEGCSCCQDIDAHKEAKEKLGKLLNVAMYDDKSGYNFSKYKTEK